MKESESEKGSLCEVNRPIIIVAASGQRCADIMRETKSFKEEEKKGMTAKLFAKHFKLAEQIERLKKGLNQIKFPDINMIFQENCYLVWVHRHVSRS